MIPLSGVRADDRNWGKAMRTKALVLALLLSGCTVQFAPPQAVVSGRPAEVYGPPPPAPAPDYGYEPEQSVVSVYVDPPMEEPEPIAIGWAPPPMLVEYPPQSPFDEAVWVGGYWVWEGDWVWAHGRWVAPPRPDYAWVHPYYENRGGVVLFITGHWSPRGAPFVRPAWGHHYEIERPREGVIRGPAPIGPDGCFVPAPPGSRRGIIVPAPVGTAPAVVSGAPALIGVGMRITQNTTHIVNNRNTTVINNISNVTNVTIEAPPSATANGRAVHTTAPALAHLAARQPALVRAQAPVPVSATPIQTYVPGRRTQSLPVAQPVQTNIAPPSPPRPTPLETREQRDIANPEHDRIYARPTPEPMPMPMPATASPPAAPSAAAPMPAPAPAPAPQRTVQPPPVRANPPPENFRPTVPANQSTLVHQYPVKPLPPKPPAPVHTARPSVPVQVAKPPVASPAAKPAVTPQPPRPQAEVERLKRREQERAAETNK